MIPASIATPAAPITGPASPVEAIAAIIARLTPLGTEDVPLDRSAGRILAAPVVSDRASPSCDVSAMDGYAVRLADLASGRLPIAGEVLIGREPPALPGGAALRIVTGAPVPRNAEAVIRREDVEEHTDHIVIPPALAERGSATQASANIRRKGENAPAESEIAPAGHIITPALAAALATFGYSTVRVYRPVHIAVITTGDEVLPVDATPTEWQLRNANCTALLNLISSAPWLLPASNRHAGDDPQTIRHAIEEGMHDCDALFLTGGVSMGTRDFVPSVLRELGAELLFHRLPQRPGKPLLGAISRRGQAIFGLPGNPISVLTTARRIATPVLGHLAGIRPSAALVDPQLVHVENMDEKRIPLWWHRPVRITAPGRVALIATAGSGDVAGTALSDGFIEVAPGQPADQSMPFYMWRLG